MYIITKQIIREWKWKGKGKGEGGGKGGWGGEQRGGRVYITVKTCMYKINVKYVHIWILVLGSRLECKMTHTVQITFIFIGQTHLVFGKRVCTCVMKHSNAFRTFLNWLKNSKRVWHERKLHIMRVPLFANFDRRSVSVGWV